MMTYEEAYKRLKRRLYEGKDGDHEDIYIAMKAIETVNNGKRRFIRICLVSGILSAFVSFAISAIFWLLIEVL